jgi:hypothetical protein
MASAADDNGATGWAWLARWPFWGGIERGRPARLQKFITSRVSHEGRDGRRRDLHKSVFDHDLAPMSPRLGGSVASSEIASVCLSERMSDTRVEQAQSPEAIASRALMASSPAPSGPRRLGVQSDSHDLRGSKWLPAKAIETRPDQVVRCFFLSFVSLASEGGLAFAAFWPCSSGQKRPDGDANRRRQKRPTCDV